MLFKEFRDVFNSYATNTTKYSMLLHTIILLPIDTLSDKQEYTYSIGYGHKSKNINIDKTIFIKSLNKSYSPNNTKKFYSKILGRYTSIVLHDDRILMN